MARGQESQHDPTRRVDRESDAYGVASSLHYREGETAADVANMAPTQWVEINEKNRTTADQNQTFHVMRAYEHYAVDTADPVPGLSK